MKIKLSNNIKKILASGTLALTTLLSNSSVKNTDEYSINTSSAKEKEYIYSQLHKNDDRWEESELIVDSDGGSHYYINTNEGSYEYNYAMLNKMQKMLMAYSNDFDNCDIVDSQIDGKKYEHVHLCFYPTLDIKGRLNIKYVNLTHSNIESGNINIRYYNTGKYYTHTKTTTEYEKNLWRISPEVRYYEPNIIDEDIFKEKLLVNYSILTGIRKKITEDVIINPNICKTTDDHLHLCYQLYFNEEGVLEYGLSFSSDENIDRNLIYTSKVKKMTRL